MSNIDSIYNVIDALSSMVNCGECNLCEGESVYLMPWEVDFFINNFGARVQQIDSVFYFQHINGSCQFYDHNKSCRNCLVYLNRPFCCRLYPLGIFNDNGIAKWGVYKHCPHIKEISSTVFYLLAGMLEKYLEKDNCHYLYKEDSVGHLIEGLKGSARLHKGNERFDIVKTVKKF